MKDNRPLNEIAMAFGITEAIKKTLEDTDVVKTLASNVRNTDKRGGKVVVTSNRNRLSFSLKKNKDGKWDTKVPIDDATEWHGLQIIWDKGSQKWKVGWSAGMTKTSSKTISDQEATSLVDKIFKASMK